MKKYDVLCPHCCGVFLETNGRFREDKPANGSMFTAKQGIVDAGWSVFPLYDTTEYDNVVCPSCSQVLLDSLGKVLRLKEVGDIEEIPDNPTQEIVKKTVDELMAEYEPELPSGLSLTEKLGAVNAEDSGSNPVGHSQKPGRPKKK